MQEKAPQLGGREKDKKRKGLIMRAQTEEKGWSRSRVHTAVHFGKGPDEKKVTESFPGKNLYHPGRENVKRHDLDDQGPD